MKAPVLRQFTIRRLWQLCDDQIFAVPEIQREFVWDTKRIGNLLDSIYRGLPIGSLLIWETNSNYRHELRHAQNVLPYYDLRNDRIWFLLDGQQRLSVLYRAKYGQSIQTSYGRIVDFNKLCLSFDDRFESHFLFFRRPVRKLHIPVPDILNPSWRRKLRYLPKSKLIEVEEIRDRLANYRIPVMIVRTNQIEEVREAFLRINSGGLRISQADRAFTRASRLNLRRLVNELRGSLPRDFSQIENRTIQAAMALVEGQKDISSKSVDSVITKLENEEIESGKVSRRFTKRWKGIDGAIRKAVDYLCSELGVVNFSFLPSDNMVALLAYFFYTNNLSQPGGLQRRELRKWFWATAVGRRYVGRGYYQNIRQDLDFLKLLGNRRSGRFRFSNLIPKADLRYTDYQVGGSLVTAYFLLLLHRNPRYLETGNRMPLDVTASVSNRKDKHHIFPKGLLIRNGFPIRDANSLCNLCYIVAEENQSFGSKKPVIYLSDFRRKKHFAAVMKSHLIPYQRESGLWIGNVRKAYRQFIRQRLNLICDAFEREAGTRLFQREV